MDNQTCGRCGSCEGCSGCGPREIRLRRSDAKLLSRFAELPFLPAVRFRLKRLGEANDETLAPVCLELCSDTLDDVQQLAIQLRRIAELGVISIHYEEALSGCDYGIYERSECFAAFCAQAEGTYIPEFEHGSMALTALGQQVLDELEFAVS